MSFLGRFRQGKAEGIPAASSLRQAVKEAYSAAAENFGGKHPFPVGREFAESVGYPGDLLDQVPRVSVDSFTGVSNLAIYADIPRGSAVLDVGCGAGLDALIAARRVGNAGKVIGIDFSEAMIDRAKKAAREAGFGNVSFSCVDAESVHVDDNSMDVVLVNGIFNLNPDREALFGTIYRALRPSGRAYASELILKERETNATVCDVTNWFT